MCGRYSVDLKWDDFARLYDLAMEGPPPWNFPPNFNQCPTDPIATVLRRDGKRAFQLMRWGLLPHFHKKPMKEWRVATFNARSEEVDTKASFKAVWKRNRCLIPMSGYYEWHYDEPENKKKKGQPYYFTAADGAPILTAAGIYSRWTNPDDGKELHTCAMMITAPNAFVAAVHDRMPVLLRPDQLEPWLDGSTGKELLVPAPENMLRKWPVSQRINSSRTPGDDPTLIAPIEIAA
jgi:putative SOS response-associated peptidase YedK